MDINNIQDDNITMDDVMNTIDEDFDIRPGLAVEGVIVSVDKDGLMVDIGGKSEAKIPLEEIATKEAANIEENFKIGDTIKARVIKTGTKEGIILSKKRVDYEAHWDEIEKMFAAKDVISGVVTETNRGGLKINVLGIPAFCPSSLIWARPDKQKIVENGQEIEVLNYEKLIGETLEFVIKEVDKSKKRIILSNRDVVAKQVAAEKKAFWDSIYEGQTREGVVKSIQSFGAFINLGNNFDGLLHISEISWGKIDNVSDVLSVGDTVEVLVIKLDKDKKKISLSLKQNTPDPWNEISEQYNINDTITVKISRVEKKCAFVDLGEGIEGLITIGQISTDMIQNASDIVKVGDEVTVKVKSIDNNKRIIFLSMKDILMDEIEAKENEAYNEEVANYEEQLADEKEAASFNLGDIISDNQE